MGISMHYVNVMESLGLVGSGKRFLDFGSSNLYGATAEDIKAFVVRHNKSPREDLDAWAKRLADGSGVDAGGGQQE